MNLQIAASAMIASTALILYTGTVCADEQKVSNKTSMFNEQWLDTIVSIEQLRPQLNPDGSVVQSSDGRIVQAPMPIGTGFIVKTNNKHLVLITAKHVVATSETPSKSEKPNLVYRINQQEGPAYLQYDKQLEQNGLGNWFLSTTADVACRFLAWEINSKFRAISPDMFMPRTMLQAGADLLILGFPMGLRSEENPSPIIRKGMVARSDKTELLADAFVFPGNSGGPALYRPPIKVKGDSLTSPFINEERLVGLVSSFLPYFDTAVSQQTKRPRIVFEENSGLARIVPADAIIELLSRDDVTKLDSIIKPN